jgi:diguanylate cyclase (GGDEF)-like protein/PAS domain S-box-containing protein
MRDPVRILMVEDTPIDAELALRVLAKAGVRHVAERVDNEADFLRMLAEFAPHIIVSDYSMPMLDGPTVLALALAHAPELPFIFLSGTIGEEVAIESLKAGATDYIIKSNMTRLPAAVERALHDARESASRQRAQRELREAQERFSLFMQHLPGPAFIKDRNGRLQFVNDAFERMASRRRHEIVGHRTEDLWPEVAASTGSHDQWVMENNRVLQTFESMRQSDGLHSYLVHKFPIPGPDGQPLLLGGVAVDFTARLEAEGRLARLSRIHACMSGINAAIVRTRNAGELLNHVCRIAVEQGGFPVAWVALLDDDGVPAAQASEGIAAEALRARLVAPPEQSREAGIAASVMMHGLPLVADAPARTPGRDHDAPLAAADGLAVAGLPIRADGRIAGVLALHSAEAKVFKPDEMKLLADLAADLSFALDYLSKKERLDYFAYFDPLTALPNRALCVDRINQAAQAHADASTAAAVVVLDLERFALVNDSLGRQAGDDLLRLVGRRLLDVVPPGGTVARVGADVFALLLGDVRNDADVARFVEERITARLAAPMRLEGKDLRIGFKCGVALVPDDGDDAEALFRNAETALKSAKAAGERYAFYAAPMNERVADILSLEHALRAALAEEQFVLHYQPKIDARSGRMYGLEALVRWNSPERGLVPPGVFLPMVEETGMILQLGLWVMQQAARDQAAWSLAGARDLRISVNVSSLQLRQKRFVEEAFDAIAAGGGDASRMDVEITESTVMQDIGHYIPKLEALRAAGMGIEIDDFGTGYSSLAYLAKLPATALKIDRSFVTAMTGTPGDRTIISTIISHGQLLKLEVIAEGVETAQQRNLLRSLGCDHMQGYLFSRPISAADVTALLPQIGSRIW